MLWIPTINRRQFLRTTALGVSASAGLSGAGTRPVTIVLDPADPVAAAAASRWAAGELAGALGARGVQAHIVDRVGQAGAGDLCVVASGNREGRAASVPEALALGPAKIGGRDVLVAAGHDARGLVYALLELADRVRNSADAGAAMICRPMAAERPGECGAQRHAVVHERCGGQALVQRSRDVAALPHDAGRAAFQSLQPELRDRVRFPARSDRRLFSLCVSVPAGRAGLSRARSQLPDEERDRNLEMLKFISEQTVARGMQFPARPVDACVRVDRQSEAELHHRRPDGGDSRAVLPRCGADAVEGCPAISGVTFRVHGESGVDEGSYDFWKTVFDGVATAGARSRSTCTPRAWTRR